VLSYLMPYAAVLLVGWVALLIVWFAVGLPVGPDAPIRMPSVSP
jgi:aminobenzoyl-glutamate transport protein